MSERRDPLEDTPPPKRGECEHCDHGWIQVSPAYAERLYPDPQLPTIESTTEQVAEFHKDMDRVHLRRVSALDSWYPCRHCSSRAFFRWLHLQDPNHDPADCDDEACQPHRRRRAQV